VGSLDEPGRFEELGNFEILLRIVDLRKITENGPGAKILDEGTRPSRLGRARRGFPRAARVSFIEQTGLRRAMMFRVVFSECNFSLIAAGELAKGASQS